VGYIRKGHMTRLVFIFMDGVTHTQRKDKVALFSKLRENLEYIKAGNFDTSSMQLIRLVGPES
jgi:sulfur relay (sulfurtransferase) complex TusBCD TusD component (DsrE family)